MSLVRFGRPPPGCVLTRGEALSGSSSLGCRMSVFSDSAAFLKDLLASAVSVGIFAYRCIWTLMTNNGAVLCPAVYCVAFYWVGQALNQVRAPYMRICRRNNVNINFLIFKVTELFRHKKFEIASLKCFPRVEYNTEVVCLVLPRSLSCWTTMFVGGRFHFREKRIASHLIAFMLSLHLVAQSRMLSTDRRRSLHISPPVLDEVLLMVSSV